MVALTIPSEYAYVLGVATLNVLHIFSLGIKTGGARKAAKVEYPYAYAEKAEAEKDPKKNVFNCCQRAHQNSLELFPIFSTLLMIGGLNHPQISAGAGVVFVLGRYIYCSNYSTGDPSKRTRGLFFMLGMITLLGTTVSTIYNLAKA